MDTSFDLRSFFSDRKNILMTIGVILLLILIPVLANAHHTPAEDKGIIPASKLVDVYLKDPQKAEKYVGKKVRLNEVPISVDNDAGETVLYTVQGTKTDEMVLFTFTADTDQNRETVRSLDPTRKVNVTGQIESVSSGNGYQVRILTVNGTIRDDFSEVPETVTEAPAAETWQGETMSEDVENTVPETTAAAPDTDSGKAATPISFRTVLQYQTIPGYIPARLAGKRSSISSRTVSIVPNITGSRNTRERPIWFITAR